MLFGGVFIVSEIRAAEACGMAFFNLAMLSDAQAAGVEQSHVIPF